LCLLADAARYHAEPGIKAVQIKRHHSPLRQRLIALAAAYALVLAGLFANLSGAQMAAAAATQPNFVICHSDAGGAGASDSGQTDSHKTCFDDCCTGCLMLGAALPQPPATAIALLASAGERIAPPAATFVVSGPELTSHRSRAPPLPA
jgi:hypothetical protein